MDLVAHFRSLQCKAREATNILHHFVQTLNYLNGNFNPTVLYRTVIYMFMQSFRVLCTTLCPEHLFIHDIGRVGALLFVIAVRRVVSVDNVDTKIFRVANS